MPSKRTSPSRGSPSSPASSSNSKLPKFLQKQSSKNTRDRSKSVTDPTFGSSSKSTIPAEPMPVLARKKNNGKLLTSAPFPITDDREPDSPVVVEQPLSPRPRTRSERPLSTGSDIPNPPVSLYASTNSNRIGDLPTRLSGWFSHTFNTSSADLSLPALMSNQSPSSSKKGSSSALLTAAKHGRGHLDKAVRYLLDSDATPDKCTDPIWLLGVQHSGYEPPPAPAPSSHQTHAKKNSIEIRRRGSPASFRSSTSSNSSLENNTNSSKNPHPSSNWPPAFYADFTTTAWLTYRSHFTPIRDARLADLSCDPTGHINEMTSTNNTASPLVKRWNNWGGGEKGWTTDTGWGCMLRTGQNLLATALIHMHLGRDWRVPPYPVSTPEYATYVQILTWFFDTPSPQAPFSVHRMALAGKELGKDVGQWFGPSTAAGALKQLTMQFPDALIGVSVASDGVVFQSDVYAASHTPTSSYASNSHNSRSGKKNTSSWGDRSVMVLLGIRLGLEGVNPIYYETIKVLYTFPQSIGIAGGRPGSSYYFVGSQADNLFYLDPHHSRPAIPLRPLPLSRVTTPDSASDKEGRKVRKPPTSPSTSSRGSSNFSYHAPISPSPLQQQYSSASGSSVTTRPSRSNSNSGSGSDIHGSSNSEVHGEKSNLTPMQEHYVTAYSAAELKTFHCERVRKMHLSALDPSMLIGFLCRDESDWVDLRRRIADLTKTHKPIFAIQDEPPNWPGVDSDDNMGLESISDDNDHDEVDLLDEPDDDEGEMFFDTRSNSASTSNSTASSVGVDVDTEEEDGADPVTPGPGSRFDIRELGKKPQVEDIEVVDDDIEDDWVDSVAVPTPTQPEPQREQQQQPPQQVQSRLPLPIKSHKKLPSSSSSKSKKSKHGNGGQVPVPVPFPISSDESPYPTPRMHNARARDGGRTQSGGVRGILTDE